MRVTFPRLPDHEPAYAVVQRDDGVVYRLYGGRASSQLPRDIRHLVVERSLGIRDGVWGAVAGQIRVRGIRAELLANLVEQAAGLTDPSDEQIRALAAETLPAETVDPADIVAAARALRVEAARWARLRIGESLSYDWPTPHNGHGLRAG